MSGADDRVPVDVSARELVLRVERLRVAVPPLATPPLKAGGLVVDLDRCEVRVDGRVVEVTPTQFQLLVLLLGRLGEVVPKRDLFEAGWDAHQEFTDCLLRPQISRLRAVLGGSVQLTAVRGCGYRLESATL